MSSPWDDPTFWSDEKLAKEVLAAIYYANQDRVDANFISDITDVGVPTQEYVSEIKTRINSFLEILLA